MLATLSDIAQAAPWAFFAGFGLGFVVGARYKISRRNGEDKADGRN